MEEGRREARMGDCVAAESAACYTRGDRLRLTWRRRTRLRVYRWWVRQSYGRRAGEGDESGPGECGGADSAEAQGARRSRGHGAAGVGALRWEAGGEDRAHVEDRRRHQLPRTRRAADRSGRAAEGGRGQRRAQDCGLRQQRQDDDLPHGRRDLARRGATRDAEPLRLESAGRRHGGGGEWGRACGHAGRRRAGLRD